ncbi:MAG: diaminobutyrate acetyltransferase [Zoogloeaceae bacterium]|nr:diaminobutyrate acetyltransferase [Zoogloeaceae bacterium]
MSRPSLNALAAAGAALAMQFCAPRLADAPRIHALVSQCPPLDLNSTYAYLLLCHHFTDTCVVARHGQELLGFISAYQPPHRPGVLFVWQVAVAKAARGEGLGQQMLIHLVSRPGIAGIDLLETTVSPSNIPSRRMFEAFAAARDAQVSEAPLFAARDFGGEDHEDEVLFRIHGLRAAPSGEPRRPHEFARL